LPKDAITGESYRYRRTDDGQFVLYSVGWNEKDDGVALRSGKLAFAANITALQPRMDANGHK
jgi:hypothetical protein